MDGRARALALSLALVACASAAGLTVIESTLHARHRPPPGQYTVETPARLDAAAEALRKSTFSSQIEWLNALDTETSPTQVVDAWKLVHSLEHLREVQAMSKVGGGFDTDTYCAPGSWEALIDAQRAWMTAVHLASTGCGPALALSRPAGHHATRDAAMGFGLVNFAAASVAAHLVAQPASTVAILDWDVHHGNGVADIFGDEPRVRYASLHEEGGFPGTGVDESARGALGNLLHCPLPKGCGGDTYLCALRERALPFLLDSISESRPSLLLICAGFDGLEADPLATMTLQPSDYAASIREIIETFGFPLERVALGLEGGYDLSGEDGMPAGLVHTCGALVEHVASA